MRAERIALAVGDECLAFHVGTIFLVKAHQATGNGGSDVTSCGISVITSDTTQVVVRRYGIMPIPSK